MQIIGAGGHAKVIMEILIESNREITGVWDDNPNLTSILNHAIAGRIDAFKHSGASAVIIGIGDNLTRKKFANLLNVPFEIAIHPKSAVSASVQVGEGTVVMANATVNAEATLGRHVIINTNASVDHDCTICDFVHLSPHASLGGNVQVGEGTHIGIGASVIQDIKIGKWATIGAGAVIIRDVPDYAVVVGNPGRLIKLNSI